MNCVSTAKIFDNISLIYFSRPCPVSGQLQVTWVCLDWLSVSLLVLNKPGYFGSRGLSQPGEKGTCSDGGSVYKKR